MIWESLVWAIKKIVEMIKKYGTSRVFQAAIILLLFITFQGVLNQIQLPNIIRNLEFKDNLLHSDGNVKRVEIDPLVRQNLLRQIVDLNCDRSFILEMHNGVSNPSGLPFRYCEMTYEELNSSKLVDEVSDQYGKVNMSNYPIFTYLMDKTLFIGTAQQLSKIDYKMSNRIQSSGVTYIALRLLMHNNKPLGVLGVSYCNQDTIKQPEEQVNIITKITEYSEKISVLLDNGK